VDRTNARIEDVLNETFDLFIELGADDDQADFPYIYAIGLHGKAGDDPENLHDDLSPLFDMILREVPAPEVEPDKATSMLVTTLDYDQYKGQLAIGRLITGELKRGASLVRLSPDGKRVNGRAEYLFTFHNLGREETDSVSAGDIVAIGGFENINISDTLADPSVTEPLPGITVEEPTVRMTFGVNTSPFAGREGKTGWGTSRRLRERLYNETRQNVALRVSDGDSPEKFVVSGRGELHLGILIETMRREGYEFEVSKPEVIFTQDENGKTLEPVEEVKIEVAEDMAGSIMEMMGERRGQMTNMMNANGTTFMEYIVPTRGLLGFQSHFMRATSGMGQVSSIFDSYQPLAGSIPGRRFGSLVAMEQGDTTTYAIQNVQQRGTFFIGPGYEVYEGMIVGEHIRPDDLPVNVCKAKHVTNHRGKPKEDDGGLATPRAMSLDDFIEFMGEDELLEVTPESLRLRKRMLDTQTRLRETKRMKQKIGE
ncbi:MAG: EF-Tu/IF-2/RF-3 family GTPase, partial [Chloroflexota bacterium]